MNETDKIKNLQLLGDFLGKNKKTSKNNIKDNKKLNINTKGVVKDMKKFNRKSQ